MPERIRTAVIHSELEGEALTDRLNHEYATVVYFSENVPRYFARLVMAKNIQGIIAHNFVPRDGPILEELLESEVNLLLIGKIAGTPKEQELITSLVDKGAVCLSRLTDAKDVVRRYHELFGLPVSYEG